MKTHLNFKHSVESRGGFLEFECLQRALNEEAHTSQSTLAMCCFAWIFREKERNFFSKGNGAAIDDVHFMFDFNSSQLMHMMCTNFV